MLPRDQISVAVARAGYGLKVDGLKWTKGRLLEDQVEKVDWASPGGGLACAKGVLPRVKCALW